MNIDPSTPAREVLIRYLESSGVNQKKEAAAEMRKMQTYIDMQKRCIDADTAIAKQKGFNSIYEALESINKPSLISRIALWFKNFFKGE